MNLKIVILTVTLCSVTQLIQAEQSSAVATKNAPAASTATKKEVVAVDAATKKQQAIIDEALHIGKMVQKLQIAIKSPHDPTSLETISLYGTDSRYYSMIRGWLFQELVGVESQLHASKSVAQAEKFQFHSNFLKQAIRLVDLE